MSGKKVLVIEDQEAILNLLGEFLEVLGYESLLALTPSEARKVAETNGAQIGAVICDVVLGPSYGPDLVKTLRPHLGEARVIYTSGFLRPEKMEGIEDGDKALFLNKPFTLESLKKAMLQAEPV